MNLLEKKVITFNEICEELDLREKKFLSGKTGVLSIGETWVKLKNRKGTFLTSR